MMMMKKIMITMMIWLSVVTSLFSQKTIFTIDENGKIVTNKQFVSEESIALQFSTSSIGSTSIGKHTYLIKTGRFENWNEEPGDFDVIQFYQDNQLLLTYKDLDGIVKLNNSANLYAYPLNVYSNNGYYIEVEASDLTKILFFVGQHYGTDLAKLLVFVVTPTDVKMVYNQKVAVISVVKKDEQFMLQVQSNIPDEGEKAVLHTIEMTGGILIFR